MAAAAVAIAIAIVAVIVAGHAERELLTEGVESIELGVVFERMEKAK